MVVGLRQLSLFDEDLLLALRGDGRVHQATATLVRIELIMVDLMQEVVNRENVIRARKRVRANKETRRRTARGAGISVMQTRKPERANR